MAKKTFTDESLSTFINEIKSYTDNAVSTKSDTSHTHTEFESILAEAKAYSDTEIAALVNSAPETLDTLGELATAFEENQDMVATLDAAITNKKDIVATITNAESSLTLNDNTEYRLSDVSSLTLSYPQGNFEIWMSISFASTGTISVIFPSTTKYIGVEPTFNNGETWEISIKDGVAICWRVE